MNVLLDTHAFLWYITGEKNISQKAISIIEDPVNTSFVSIASIWEISIKVSLGKLKLKGPLSELFSIGYTQLANGKQARF